MSAQNQQNINHLIKKTMSRSEWMRIIKREYVFQNFDGEDFRGAVGLLRMLEVREPLSVNCAGTDLKIVDNGFEWLQFAYEDKNYWLTVMFDNDGQIIEYYFDITDGNFIEQDGCSWFYDLYLDVVMQPCGKITLLDENELDEALKIGVINQAQYDLAAITAEELMDEIKGREKELAVFCMNYRDLLKDRGAC